MGQDIGTDEEILGSVSVRTLHVLRFEAGLQHDPQGLGIGNQFIVIRLPVAKFGCVQETRFGQHGFSDIPGSVAQVGGGQHGAPGVADQVDGAPRAEVLHDRVQVGGRKPG